MKYSKSTGGFYTPEIHAAIPADAVEITSDEHKALLAGQASGMRIVPSNDGRPTLMPPTAPTREQQQAMLEGRLGAA